MKFLASNDKNILGTKKDILPFFKSVANPDTLVLIGMGNPDRADDGFGIELARRLKVHFPGQVFSEQEKSVEGIVLDLVGRERFEIFLFIDATDFGGEPGEVHLFSAEDAERFVPAFSTHKVPITLLMEMVRQHGKKSFLLGLQPESLEFLGEMSETVSDMLDHLEGILYKFFRY